MQTTFDSLQRLGISKLLMAVSLLDKLHMANKFLKRRVVELEDEVEELFLRLHDLEVELYTTQQELRREDVEISGIPSHVSDEKLLGVVLSIMDRIVTNPIHDTEVDSCQRSTGPGKTAVIRFKGRARSDEIKRNSKRIDDMDFTDLAFSKDVKIYINENLCPYYKELHNKCRLLRHSRKITKLMISDGQIKIKLPEKSHWMTVYHESVLMDLFPEFNYDVSPDTTLRR